ncbi:MAG TPA: hypothetical protein VNO32_33320 [Candidatus Acidoferrum sp.]|jgi:hypothetical protein|nr:hypothetical protein [Candidatus Acidoferrum sp.]
MPSDQFTGDESRKLAVLIARIWANPQLASQYQEAPAAVLSGAGINLGDRAVPGIPEKPSELAAQRLVSSVSSDSASSLSTITCPCSACTASCANCKAELLPDSSALMKLADSPESRAQARKMTAAWSVSLKIQS